MITSCQPESIRGHELHVQLKTSAKFDQQELGELLTKLVRGATGREFAVMFDAPILQDKQDRLAAYTRAQDHPVVQDLLERFEGEVIAREPSRRAEFFGDRDSQRD